MKLISDLTVCADFEADIVFGEVGQLPEGRIMISKEEDLLTPNKPFV